VPQTMTPMVDTTVTNVSGREVMSTGERKSQGEKRIFETKRGEKKGLEFLI